MYVLKKTVTRAVALVATIGLLGGMLGSAIAPNLAAADSLNPLTDRSLTLSTSSPGWAYTDGSNNPWDISCYNPTTLTETLTDCNPGYSPYGSPSSGSNGQKTGETFSFKVSTNSSADGTNDPIKAMTFQYCTTPAGGCTAPGDDAYLGSSAPYTRGPDTTSTSDLSVNLGSGGGAPAEIGTGVFGTTAPSAQNKLDNDIIDSATGNPYRVPTPDNAEGNFVVETQDVGDGTWTYSPGWVMSTSNEEDYNYQNGGTPGAPGTGTGKDNLITLKATGTGATGLGLHSTGEVKVIFFGTNTNYITNPGNDAFFVKINDYNSDTTIDNTTLVDGGVTVANVMNQSIQIETKVLETMDFSVGTVDPDTLTDAELSTATAGSQTAHGQCDPVLTALSPSDQSNFLLLGNQTAESSLATNHTYATYSYFRLSSNSTGGATVYYAGTTLTDTEGDQITPMGTSGVAPHTGTPQFGLALDNNTSGTYAVNYNDAGGALENAADGGPTSYDASFYNAGNGNTGTDTSSDTDVHAPQLAPLVPGSAYLNGTGVFDSSLGSINTDFGFDGNANNVPAILASENSTVVDCVTGKVRYVANIAATTPAGIYTTKLNYIASPQY